MEFGKKTTTTVAPNGSSRIVQESFHKGKNKGTKIWYEVPRLVEDKSSTLSDIIKGLDLITSRQTNVVVFTVEGNHKGGFRIVTKKYEVGE